MLLVEAGGEMVVFHILLSIQDWSLSLAFFHVRHFYGVCKRGEWELEYKYVWIYENEAKDGYHTLSLRFFLARNYLQRGRYKN